MWEENELEAMYGAMFRRRSVRALDPETLPLELLEETIKNCARTTPLAPTERVAFRILQPDQIKGMVGAKAPHYLAVYAGVGTDARMNAAFRMQQMDLWFSSRGLGSCWLGMPKPVQEAATVDGMDFVILLAFGRAKEYPWRDSEFEFNRKAFQEITNIPDMDEFLESARLAPSGMNRQPWYFCGGWDALHLYGKRNGAIQKRLFGLMPYLDLGIVLCHLWLAALGAGAFAGFQKKLDGKAPGGYAYAWSVLLDFPQHEPPEEEEEGE